MSAEQLLPEQVERHDDAVQDGSFGSAKSLSMQEKVAGAGQSTEGTTTKTVAGHGDPSVDAETEHTLPSLAEDGQQGGTEPAKGVSNALEELQHPKAEARVGKEDIEPAQQEAVIDLAPAVPIKDEQKSANQSSSGFVAQNAVDERTAIQNEAIEHLARRSSSMSAEPLSQNPIPVHKDAKLPAVPPPPPVPEKIAPEVPEKVTGSASDSAMSEDEDAQGVPEAPQGTTEQAGDEIQHIIEQFQAIDTAMGEEEIMSPRLERQQPVLQLPPRTSSLGERPPAADTVRDHYFAGHAISSRTSVVSLRSQAASAADETSSITSHRTSIFQPPPPSPDPEPVLPFDFHRFLEQLRHRTADPVARFLRSFLQEFGKKQWMVHEQVKIIGDFLEFISKKMAQCEVWRTVSDAEFDNAREGMEKLVMNRLYTQTFSPAIPAASGSPRKGKNVRSAADVANQTGTGRKGQHQEDVERDEVIAQKMRIYGWIKEEHLDIKPIGEKGKRFLTMAQQELLKLNTYRAPRDKVICVLNCCKVIFGYLKNSKGDQGADAFVPLLIYTVLRARPEHLVSNVQYIWRFRNQDKLGGEAGYYMSSLMGVVTFMENLDRTMITISDEDFEKNVEQAVSAIAEGHQAGEHEQKPQIATASASASATTALTSMQHLSEKAAASRPEVTARNSAEVQRSSPRRQNVRQAPNEESDTDAVTGLLRTIQKPLSSIGRIFSDDTPPPKAQQDSLRPGSTPLPPRTSSRGLSPAVQIGRSTSQSRYEAQDAAARQASVETADRQREQQRGFAVVVETLQGMFPNLEKEVIEDVVRAQEGNVQRAVDACLSLSSQT